MNKRVAALGGQLQQECIKAQEFIFEHDLSTHPLSATISKLTDIAQQLMDMVGTDSSNSHLPPSQDPHREKSSNAQGKRKPGGQPGHKGSKLELFETPDKIIRLEVDAAKLLPGSELVDVKKRQVVEIKTERFVVEYQADVYRLPNGAEITAEFPKGVNADIQYGQSVKALVTYSSTFQLMPYRRIVNLLSSQLAVPISEGSVYNFLKEAYQRLDGFEEWLLKQLAASPLLHVDETGINISGKTNWIHTVSTTGLTHLAPHAKRGKEAIEDIGVLPGYSGLVCHD